MSLREWLIIIGALVILGVLIDGFRRTLRARREAQEFSRGMGSSEIANTPLDDEFNPELPGGSRVVRPGYDSEDYDGPVPERPQPLYEPTRAEDNSEAFSAEQPEPTFSEPAAEDREPTPAQPERRREPAVDAEPEPSMSASGDSEPLSAEKDEPAPASAREGEGSTVEEFTQGARSLWKKLRDTTRAQMDGGDPAASRSGSSDPIDAPGSESETSGSERPLAGANRPEAREVIVVNVHCRDDGQLSGAQLKRLLEGCGLEFGAMDIYHRHEEPDTRSPVQFSVANAVSPGTLRPDQLPHTDTPGISFFMSLPGPQNPLQAFEYMLETAQTVVRNLGGELKDEDRSVMTAQTVEHCRQRIREFERRQHFAR